MNSKNIQISYELFKDLLWVLESLDISNYDKPFKDMFEGVLEALQSKQKAIDRRETYSKLIVAHKTKDEEKQLNARIEYLKKRDSF